MSGLTAGLPLIWRDLDENTSYAHSRNRLQYLVVRDDDSTTVRLCRVSETVPMHQPMTEAREALRTEIVLMAQRGPGRPPGEPEMRELVARARGYAEQYDCGKDLEWPGWQHATELVRAAVAWR